MTTVRQTRPGEQMRRVLPTRMNVAYPMSATRVPRRSLWGLVCLVTLSGGLGCSRPAEVEIVPVTPPQFLQYNLQDNGRTLVVIAMHGVGEKVTSAEVLEQNSDDVVVKFLKTDNRREGGGSVDLGIIEKYALRLNAPLGKRIVRDVSGTVVEREREKVDNRPQ